MYKSDKTATEHAFLPFLLGVVAIEGISSQNNDYALVAKDAFRKACGEKEQKILKRCNYLASEIITPIRNKQTEKISGHKFIIFLHALAQKILDSGYLLPDYVINSFDKFLDLERQMEINDNDWLKLKNSAEKIASKVSEELKRLNYFNVEPVGAK